MLDGNGLNTHTKFPFLPNLRTLWLNNNKIENISIILDTLVQSTPNLKELSLLKNPCCPNYLTGGKPSEYADYRQYVISRLQKLEVLDTTAITTEERNKAEQVYGTLPFSKQVSI